MGDRFNPDDHLHPDWHNTMGDLFKSLVEQCRQNHYYNADNLSEENTTLRAAALTDGLDEETARRKKKSDCQKLKRWLNKNYLEFKTRMEQALQAAYTADQQRGGDAAEVDEVVQNPQQGAEVPDVEPAAPPQRLLMSEPDHLVELNDEHFDPEGVVAPGELLRFEATFRPELCHSPLAVKFGLIDESDPIAMNQVYMASSARSAVQVDGGGRRQIDFENMEVMASIINLLHYLTSSANFETATSLIFSGQPEHTNDGVQLELVAAELSVPRPYVSQTCMNAALKLVLTWLGQPQLQEDEDGSTMDCSQLGVSELFAKLRLRSGNSIILCTNCVARKCRLPFLTWPMFLEAAAAGSFPVETGVCIMPECGNLAFKTKRLNGSSFFVLAPEPVDGQGIPVMDAALLHQAPGYVDVAVINSKDLRCQAALVWSTSGMVAVVRGRQGPWQCIHPNEPEEAQSAEGVIGQAVAFFFASP